ncbi:MAG: thiamine-phosphate kinase [Spongiibacteraceae bacterium]|jgi:thiamine-monophosphate kinase|nr:thiamine-phosphate kinase [Spongiibacteraceae bacterium]
MSESPTEFELIERWFADLGVADLARIALGVGDDCALLQPQAGEQLALSVDTLVAGVHFPHLADPALVARRALRVNLSDLAATGAQPVAFTLALTLPQVDVDWLSGFASGLAADAQQFGIRLIGGDTTRGEQLTLTLQVMGVVPAGAALLRAGARPGDCIAVSGELGAAAAAVALLERPASSLTAAEQALLTRYWLPEPRLALGQALRGIASAALDLSDGLAGDLSHILRHSGVGAELEEQALPRAAGATGPVPLAQALHGGDDYELCFTYAPGRAAEVAALGRQLGIAITDIGRITAQPGLFIHGRDAQRRALDARGYRHF